MTLRSSLATLTALLALAAPLPARQIRLEVRVRAADAKLIGDAVGGARVTVTDVETGRLLAEGTTAGGTGDTGLIMRTPRERGATVYDTPGAAGWLAAFDLDRPARVEIAAEGPLDYPQVDARASTTLLLAPGAEILGEGVVLTLNGFIVEIQEPAGGASGPTVNVRARVRMLCSCPTEPGGLWSVGSVTARLLADGKVVAEAPLDFAGETSLYAGTVTAPGSGRYDLEVLAADPSTANYGRDRTEITVR